ncbi:helix-turn-helix transcriptional regulator [Agromyces sp. SYSU T00194]|uniref:helix-turn-helix transcriptional regulator n=1 Tax=Agromyces chitinivorans TaxID=3158560 RepID=UPI00339412E3
MPSSAAANQDRVSVEERLFSLVLALLATESGLTKSEILSTVQGYRQRYDRGGANQALERQFERDKDDVRELGIPIETLESPDRPGDNQSLRYRIPKGLYDLPDDVTFTPEESALLALAATVWREGSLSGESRRALTKLRSLGVEPREPVIGYAPRLRVRDSAFEPLSQALDRRQVVRFDYLNPGRSAPRRRTVAPWAVVLHEGRWHLYAWDRELGARRTFLLSRIVGDVSVVPGSTFDAPEPGMAEQALAELDELWRSQVADLEVEPDSDAAVRLARRRGAIAEGTGYRLHYTDAEIVADELAAFGPEVRVTAPATLADGVRSRLERVASAHDGGDD